MNIYKIKNSFFIILMITIRFSAFSQITPRTIYGLGIDQFSTANGHGSFYSPSLSLSRHKNTFLISPLIQKRTLIINGFRLTYTRNLSGEPSELLDGYGFDFFQINFTSSIQFNNKLPLSYRMIQNERSIQREPELDLNQIKFSTAEVMAGFQLQINITSTVSWKTYAGVALYHHLNYVPLRGHEQTGITLCLGTGIHIQMPQL